MVVIEASRRSVMEKGGVCVLRWVYRRKQDRLSMFFLRRRLKGLRRGVQELLGPSPGKRIALR